MMRKWLAIGIILLFVGVTIAPTINFNTVEASDDKNLIQPSYQTRLDSIIWDNYEYSSNSIGFSSQLDIEYPFNSQCADDFILEDDNRVTGVHWWGCFIGGDPPWPNPTDFNIIFYADDGTGTMPTGAGMEDPTPTALAVYFKPDVTGVLCGPYNSWFEYNITLPEQFNITANTKYWIAIQETLPIPPQWCWLTNGNNPDQLHAPVQGFPILEVPYWTDLSFGDMAFQLYGGLNYAPLPPVIHGPYNGDVNVKYSFWTDPIIDPLGESLYIRWDWDDGNITDWLGPYSSGSIVYASHAWEDAGVYDIRAKLKGTGGESNWSEPLTITVVQNQPPSTPLITGPLKGKPGITYNYEFIATDSESENISYYVDWGDGTNTGWIGPYPSGQEQIMNHTWTKKRTYTIKAKAMDSHDRESDWGSLSVIMPYEPPHYRFFEWLFERFPHAFPLLRYLLNV
ncbi:MAG TPA: hypothetical protein VN365_04535 [Candidatus Thermoplasmatota archaeon]|nr:hypothetical protein [Candidatus Thermoplasmatota archaeon]